MVRCVKNKPTLSNAIDIQLISDTQTPSISIRSIEKFECNVISRQVVGTRIFVAQINKRGELFGNRCRIGALDLLCA